MIKQLCHDNREVSVVVDSTQSYYKVIKYDQVTDQIHMNIIIMTC